jgi:hypothetical protein
MATATSPRLFEIVKCRLCARRDMRAAVCVLVLLAYGLSSRMSFLDDVSCWFIGGKMLRR